METFGTLFTLALGVLFAHGGAYTLWHFPKAYREACWDAAIYARGPLSWRMKAWIAVLYFVAPAGLLAFGTAMVGVALVDLIC